MRATRLPTFAANILSPIDKAIAGNRPIEDIAGIIEEIRMFACPNCGHITPDHSWIGDPMRCLVPECPCLGFDVFWEEPLLADIDDIVHGRIVA